MTGLENGWTLSSSSATAAFKEKSENKHKKDKKYFGD